MSESAASHPLAPPVRNDCFRGLGPIEVVAVERILRDETVEFRPVAQTNAVLPVRSICILSTPWVQWPSFFEKNVCKTWNGFFAIPVPLQFAGQRHPRDRFAAGLDEPRHPSGNVFKYHFNFWRADNPEHDSEDCNAG